jgi:hypothetical protein
VTRLDLPAGVRPGVRGAGLAVIDGHLVADVTNAEFPDADVLALEAPGGESAVLAVQCESATGSSQRPPMAHHQTVPPRPTRPASGPVG